MRRAIVLAVLVTILFVPFVSADVTQTNSSSSFQDCDSDDQGITCVEESSTTTGVALDEEGTRATISVVQSRSHTNGSYSGERENEWDSSAEGVTVRIGLGDDDPSFFERGVHRYEYSSAMTRDGNTSTTQESGARFAPTAASPGPGVYAGSRATRDFEGCYVSVVSPDDGVHEEFEILCASAAEAPSTSLLP